MYICKYCDEQFDTKKKRASHYKKHPEYKQENDAKQKLKRELLEKSNIVCISCNKKFDSENSLAGHKRRNVCGIKEKTEGELKDLSTEIEKLYESGLSVLAIYDNLQNKKYITYNSLRQYLEAIGKQLYSISESSLLDSVKSRKAKTNIERYGGMGNVLSRGSSIYDKRNSTVKEKYGVDNVFQSEDIKNKIFDDLYYLEKYGTTRNELISQNSKNMWSSYTREERKIRSKQSSLKSAKTFQENNNGKLLSDHRSEIMKQKWETMSYEEIKKRLSFLNSGRSGLEKHVEKFLETLQVEFSINFLIKSDGRKRGFFYDFLVNKKYIIEVNGDFWHANPKFYLQEDILSFPGGQHIIAGELWEKDRIKKEAAIAMGYNILYLWESDMKTCEWEQEVLDFLKGGD